MTRDELISQITAAFEYVAYPSVSVVGYEEPEHSHVDDFWQIAQWLTGRPRDSLSDWELFLVARFGHGLAPEIVHYYASTIMIRALMTENPQIRSYLLPEASECPFPMKCFNWPQRECVVRFIEFLAPNESWLYWDAKAETLVRKWRGK